MTTSYISQSVTFPLVTSIQNQILGGQNLFSILGKLEKYISQAKSWLTTMPLIAMASLVLGNGLGEI